MQSSSFFPFHSCIAGALEEAAQGSGGVTIPGGVQKTCRYCTWFSWHGGVGLTVGLDDLRGLF